MSFRVIISRTLEDAIEAQVLHLRTQAVAHDRLDRWLAGPLDLIESLSQWPRRIPVAEAVSAMTGYEVRRANRGDYAIFFRVDDERRVVEILAFRHGRQQPWIESDRG